MRRQTANGPSWGPVMRGVPEYRPWRVLDERGAVPAPFSVIIDIDLMQGEGGLVA